MNERDALDNAKNLVRSRFKDSYGNPFEMTDGQAEIFCLIFGKSYPRGHVRTWSQYGKSDVTSMAVLSRITVFPDKFAIIAPKDEKAKIIMGYLIDHIFDNDYTIRLFQRDRKEKLESIRRERSKSHVTFKLPSGEISEVLTLSAEGKRKKDIVGALLGFGSRNIILDESPLITDDHYDGVLRMLGGHKENFLCEIGNAIGRNHFYRSSKDPEYRQIVIDYRQGIREGRQSAQYFREMEAKMDPTTFMMLYDCKFPDAASIDEAGYMTMITEKELEQAYVQLKLFGDIRMGIDVAAGGNNRTAITVRGENAAVCAFLESTSDTMSIITQAKMVAATYQVKFDDKHVFIDKVGVGQGLCDRLNEMHQGQNFGLNVGTIAYPELSAGIQGQTLDYMNLRAQAYWHTGEWIHKGGKLWPKPRFDDLLGIRYKIQSDRKIKIKPKEEMREEGLQSPDVADSLMLTFCLPKSGMRRMYRQAEYSPATSFGV